MQKETDKSKTLTSGYNPLEEDYWYQDTSNIGKLIEYLKNFFPDASDAELNFLLQNLPILMQFNQVRFNMGMSYETLLSFMYKVHMVKNLDQGYGEVKATITNGMISKIEAMWRDLVMVERPRSG